MRVGVEQQIYRTNVSRVEKLRQASLERYESDMDSLDNLEINVK